MKAQQGKGNTPSFLPPLPFSPLVSGEQGLGATVGLCTLGSKEHQIGWGCAGESRQFLWEWASVLEVGDRRCWSVSRLAEPANLMGIGEWLK